MGNDYPYWNWHRPRGGTKRSPPEFVERGIKGIIRPHNLTPEILVQNYLAGSLVSEAKVCGH
jgi:hypothetical protein